MYQQPDAMYAVYAVLQASHVGKVVVAAPAPQHLQSPTAVNWAGRVVITGGLGTLGLLTASWLVRQGVQQLVLVSAMQCHGMLLAAYELVCNAAVCMTCTAIRWRLSCASHS
jgi:hypothetical protein